MTHWVGRPTKGATGRSSKWNAPERAAKGEFMVHNGRMGVNAGIISVGIPFLQNAGLIIYVRRWLKLEL